MAAGIFGIWVVPGRCSCGDLSQELLPSWLLSTMLGEGSGASNSIRIGIIIDVYHHPQHREDPVDNRGSCESNDLCSQDFRQLGGNWSCTRYLQRLGSAFIHYSHEKNLTRSDPLCITFTVASNLLRSFFGHHLWIIEHKSYLLAIPTKLSTSTHLSQVFLPQTVQYAPQLKPIWESERRSMSLGSVEAGLRAILINGT